MPLILASFLASCQTTEVSKETLSMADYLKVRDDNAICETATLGTPPKWSPYAGLFVAEAKRRKLTCGVKANSIIQPQIPATKSKYAYLNTRAICYFATSNGIWETKSNLLEYVREAERRGLNCGIGNRNEADTEIAHSDKTVLSTDDVAVIIANANYTKLGRGIPDVKPAYNDAENIKEYFTQSLGVREGNIIYLKDATKAQLTSIFGSEKNHRGKLFNWAKPNISRIYIYYAGHGAPGENRTAYLVPSDTDNETVQLTAYPLQLLYSNLKKISARSITVILEACFSGNSQGGYLFDKVSGISITPKMPAVSKKTTVISAGAANQVASWERDGSQSLFTKYFLKGMYGEGDKRPQGNGDGVVSLKELKKYLDNSLTYYARRYYGRNQNAQIVVDGNYVSVKD